MHGSPSTFKPRLYSQFTVHFRFICTLMLRWCQWDFFPPSPELHLSSFYRFSSHSLHIRIYTHFVLCQSQNLSSLILSTCPNYHITRSSIILYIPSTLVPHLSSSFKILPILLVPQILLSQLISIAPTLLLSCIFITHTLQPYKGLGSSSLIHSHICFPWHTSLPILFVLFLG